MGHDIRISIGIQTDIRISIFFFFFFHCFRFVTCLGYIKSRNRECPVLHETLPGKQIVKYVLFTLIYYPALGLKLCINSQKGLTLFILKYIIVQYFS